MTRIAIAVLALGFVSVATAAELGVCFHHGAYGNEYTPAAAAVLDDLRSAGPFWIRGDFQEPAKDAAFAADMARKGIQVLALLPWYSKDLSGWQAYVKKQVEATPNVPAWEIANEPEMSWWGGPIPSESYIRMLREARGIIKAANRDARIVGPAVGATAEGVAYLSSLIGLGLLDLVDAISVHYYVYHRSLQLDAVKRIVSGRKPLWITETGWTTADQEGAEQAQRTYVQRYYDPSSGILGADPAVEVVFNYELNDEHCPAIPGKDDGWGLTYGPEGAFGKKAGYEDFKRLLNPESPFSGRWDVTLHTPERDYSSWLDIAQKNDELRVRMVGRWGHARYLPIAEAVNGGIRFVSPKEEEGRADDMVFEGRVQGSMLEGTTSGADGAVWTWRAEKAPTLERERAPHWGAPRTLFNGKDLSGWRSSDPSAKSAWAVSNGTLVSPGGGADLQTDAVFEDFKLHIEFNCAPKANSGVYLRGRYEVQIDDSDPPAQNQRTGGIYGYLAPSTQTVHAPGKWHAFDITLVGRNVTVALDGKTVIEDQEIPGITGGALDSREALPGPIFLQGSEPGRVEFRNIVITAAQSAH